ncbi:uncharacterized protein QYS62_004902 [Fusarium acuminatum]|uniref:Apple domain-containing protein n=1 Tax=Fusarium acuminatum TaxID=5515 RepID=A0ABZ2WVU2_9HYPO
MKASTASILIALLGTTQVYAQCVEGAREEISPDYTVQYKCDMLRVGDTHRNINSAIECAALARDAGATASTYHAPTKRCVVASENGAERAYSGAICMVKVEDDPFVDDGDDPFALDCEEEKDACLERERLLKADLAASQAQSSAGKADSDRLKDILASNYPDAAGPKETLQADTMEACVKLCNARSWCTYVLHGTFKTTCQLYNRAFAHGTSPANSDSLWNSAVKKI